MTAEQRVAAQSALSLRTIEELNTEVRRSRASFPDERAHFVAALCNASIDEHCAKTTAIAVRLADLANTLADSIMLDRPIGRATAIKLAALAVRIAEEGPLLDEAVSK